MSKYGHLKDDILKEYRRSGTPSDQLATKFAGPEDNVASLGRVIRKWLQEEPTTKAIHPPKILVFDIETAPMICYAWSKWQDSISDSQIVQDWFILSWSAKWLMEDEMISEKLTQKEIKNADDKRITKRLWNILDEADIVIAHNLKKFDKKKSQTRFLKHRLGLPSHYLEIDTLLVARKEFKVTSNRLDYLAGFLGLDGKLSTPKGLWEDCMKGDMKAMEKMVEYCEQDVRVLEDVYLELRPYIKNHPNIGLFIDSDKPVCKGCGHDEFESDGFYRTTANVYEGLRCKSCGLQHRSRQPITSKETRKRLLR